MAGVEDQREMQRVVRSFSDDFAAHHPQNQLAQSIVDSEEGQDKTWKHWYRDEADGARDPDMHALDVECRLLGQTWQIFQELLREGKKDLWGKPKEERGKGTDPGAMRLTGPDAQMADFRSIFVEFEAAKSHWESKRRHGGGRAQLYLHQFCRTLESHSNMFSILPSNEKYVSIFCGSVRTLIKASVNHQKIAEGLARSLVEIGEEIAIAKQEYLLVNSKPVQQAIAKMYAHVFLFLREAMQWYSSGSMRKVLDSLQEDFYDKFSRQVDNIKRFSQLVSRTAQVGHIAEARDIRLGLEGMARQKAEDEYEKAELRRQLEASKTEVANLQAKENRRKMAQAMYGLLASNYLSFIREKNSGDVGVTAENQHHDPGTRLALGPAENKTTSTTSHCYLRDDLQRASRDLEDHIPSQFDLIDNSSGPGLWVEEAIAVAIQEWSMSDESQLLWIAGPSEHRYPTIMSRIAAGIVSSTIASHIPVCYFFCDVVEHEGHASGMSREEACLMALLYALVRQLIELLPPQLETPIDLTPSRFAPLNGTVTSLAPALSVLVDLLSLTPPLLLLIIDGLDWLDDSPATASLRDILDALRRHERWTQSHPQPESRVFKALFTTAGLSHVLANKLRDQEMVVDTTSRALRSPGQSRPGRKSLG